MNIFNYKPEDKDKFTEYLLSIGVNNNGVNETLKRFDEERPDREDLKLYERYKAICWQQSCGIKTLYRN